MTNSTYTPSVHLFVDMDGTLATWKQAACYEDLLQGNYFRDLPPYEEVVDAINWLNSIHPEIDVHILSEKNEWLDTYLPAIPKASRIFVPCGISKAEAAAKAIGESTINSSCILLDDYSINLYDWKENGGGCIKLRNGINGNGGTWRGHSVSRFATHLEIANNIWKHIKEISGVKDYGREE